MRCKLCFDCAEFHAISTNFHLSIDAAVIVKVAARVTVDKIARAIHASERAMFDKACGCCFRLSAITARKGSTADDEFAL